MCPAIRRPLSTRPGVVVEVEEQVIPGRGGARVAGIAQTMVFLADVADARKARRDRRSVVGRSVIDQDRFVSRVVDFA